MPALLRFEKPGYFTLPRALFARGISCAELAVLAYLSCCADKAGQCCPAVHTVAEACGLGEGKAREVLRTLAEKGLLAMEHRYMETGRGMVRQGANRYTLLFATDGNRKKEGVPPQNEGEGRAQEQGVPSPGEGGGYPFGKGVGSPCEGEINRTNPNGTEQHFNNHSFHNLSLTNPTEEAGVEKKEEQKKKREENAHSKKSPPSKEELVAAGRYLIGQMEEAYYGSDTFRDPDNRRLVLAAFARLYGTPFFKTEHGLLNAGAVRAVLARPPGSGCLYEAFENLRAARNVRDPVAYFAACYLRAALGEDPEKAAKDAHYADFFRAAVEHAQKDDPSYRAAQEAARRKRAGEAEAYLASLAL